MISIKRIFPECNADTLLVELVLQRKWAYHCHGINEVGIELNKHYRGKFIIGLVDNDKFIRPEPRLKLYTDIVVDKKQDEGLIIKKEPDTEKHVIVLHPAFERWLWKLAVDNNCIGLNGINSFEDLKSETKSNKVNDNQKLIDFIKVIVNANPPAIQTLRTWLEKAV